MYLIFMKRDSFFYYNTQFSCSDKPSFYTVERNLTMTLHRKSVNANQYNFKLRITAVRGNNEYCL